MTSRNVLTVVLALAITLTVTVGLISINHPIILKWMTGNAKHHGAPIPAIAYTNGKVNNEVKVFYTDEPNNYLVSLGGSDLAGRVNFINVNVSKKTIERPKITSTDDYDFIAGHLFQSESGAQFSVFQDTTHSDFNPLLSFTESKLQFRMPPNNLDVDSVRIVFR
jgi:hypothetical protein